MPSLRYPTLALALALTARPATAQTVAFDGEDSANILPFGAPFDGPQYQQLYLGSAFGAAPVRITALRVFGDEFFSAGLQAATYTLRLATTPQSLATPSVNFAANLGPDLTTVFSAALAATPVAAGAPFEFTFTTPFLFNPAGGNLVVELLKTNVGAGTNVGGLFDAFSGPSTTRVYNQGGAAVLTVGYGLRTTFVTSSASTVPEPSTYVLLGTGLLALGGVARRRRSS